MIHPHYDERSSKNIADQIGEYNVSRGYLYLTKWTAISHTPAFIIRNRYHALWHKRHRGDAFINKKHIQQKRLGFFMPEFKVKHGFIFLKNRKSYYTFLFSFMFVTPYCLGKYNISMFKMKIINIMK